MKYATGVQGEKLLFFFGKEDPFSQWHPRGFTLRNRYFPQAECFMMYCKAMLFRDYHKAEEILATTDPRDNKRQGREVQGFVEEVWKQKCEFYVFVGNLAKFSQHESLKACMLSTVGAELVEASPCDRTWGVGLASDDPRILDKTKWRGLNLLGKDLMKVRDVLEQGREQEYLARFL